LPLVLLVAACGGGGVTSRVAALYGGPEGWSAIETPEKVTAFRIIRPGVLQHVRAPETLAGFEVIQGPLDVDPAVAAELRAILADDAIYDWERAKKCVFDPGVAFRFAKGGSDLDVLLCFHCDEFAAYRGDKRVGGEDFDVARPRLLALVQRVFPGDEQIQALKPRR
jgi:hypothetical protein